MENKSLQSFSYKCWLNSWRKISTHSLWTEVVTHKYIATDSLEDWIQNPNMRRWIASVIWKATINSFHLVEESLAWRVWRSSKVGIGEDSCLGCQRNHILRQPVIQHIHLQGLYHLDQIVDPASTTFWNQGWMDAHRLGLRDAQVDAWNVYVNALWSSHLRLTDRPDELIWNSALEGIYTPKLGYIQLIYDLQNRDPH